MFYFIEVHPCTCHVKHESTVLELRAVLDLATLNGYRQFSFFSVYFTRHKLEKTLYTVEYTAVAASPYLNACAFDCEDILLRRIALSVDSTITLSSTAVRETFLKGI